MANLTITNIKFPTTIPKPNMVKLSEACAQFDVLYKDSSSTYALADATSEAKAKAAYIALLAGGVNDRVPVIPLEGDMELVGPTLSVSDQYVLSATGGKICPRIDLVSTNFVTDMFVAETTAIAKFDVEATGVQEP